MGKKLPAHQRYTVVRQTTANERQGAAAPAAAANQLQAACMGLQTGEGGPAALGTHHCSTTQSGLKAAAAPPASSAKASRNSPSLRPSPSDRLRAKPRPLPAPAAPGAPLPGKKPGACLCMLWGWGTGVAEGQRVVALLGANATGCVAVRRQTAYHA